MGVTTRVHKKVFTAWTGDTGTGSFVQYPDEKQRWKRILKREGLDLHIIVGSKTVTIYLDITKL